MNKMESTTEYVDWMNHLSGRKNVVIKRTSRKVDWRSGSIISKSEKQPKFTLEDQEQTIH